MSYYASHVGDPSEKAVHTGELRRAFRGDPAYAGDVARHKCDLALAAAGIAYARGPMPSDEYKAGIAHVLSGAGNVHYHGTARANAADRVAMDEVLRAYERGERAVLGAHGAAHIREVRMRGAALSHAFASARLTGGLRAQGAAYLAEHKRELPAGFVRTMSSIYGTAVDADGHKVVDRRSLRM